MSSSESKQAPQASSHGAAAHTHGSTEGGPGSSHHGVHQAKEKPQHEVGKSGKPITTQVSPLQQFERGMRAIERVERDDINFAKWSWLLSGGQGWRGTTC